MNISLPKIKATQLLNAIGSPLLVKKEELLDFCSYHNVYVDFDELNHCEGRISSYNNRAIVTIKPNTLYPSRERFSIAHELGHFFLHKNIMFSCDLKDLSFWKQEEGNKKREFEANQFASELLMPTKIFIEKMGKGKVTFEQSIEASEFFNTSLISSIIKGIEVSSYATAAVFFRPGFSEYAYISPAMREMFIYPRIGRLDDNSCARSASTYQKKTDIKNVHPEAWFNETYKIKNYQLTEETNYFSNIKMGISLLTLNLK